MSPTDLEKQLEIEYLCFKAVFSSYEMCTLTIDDLELTFTSDDRSYYCFRSIDPKLSVQDGPVLFQVCEKADVTSYWHFVKTCLEDAPVFTVYNPGEGSWRWRAPEHRSIGRSR